MQQIVHLGCQASWWVEFLPGRQKSLNEDGHVLSGGHWNPLGKQKLHDMEEHEEVFPVSTVLRDDVSH